MSAYDSSAKVIRRGSFQAATAAVSAAYDKRSACYGTHVATYRDPALTLIMLEGLRLALALKVLDLGAGQGDGAAHLRAVGADVISADVSEVMLRQGLERGTVQGGGAIRCDMRHSPLPFQSKSFDLVVLRYAAHDVQDKGLLLAEIRRVMIPGGRVQLVDMSVRDREALAFYNQLHAAKTVGDPVPCWILSPAEYRQLLKEAGFTVESELWYQSRVSSLDWLAEEQITEARHDELLRFVRLSFSSHPLLRKIFNARVRLKSFWIEFPVVCLTAQYRKR